MKPCRNLFILAPFSLILILLMAACSPPPSLPPTPDQTQQALWQSAPTPGAGSPTPGPGLPTPTPVGTRSWHDIALTRAADAATVQARQLTWAANDATITAQNQATAVAMVGTCHRNGGSGGLGTPTPVPAYATGPIAVPGGINCDFGPDMSGPVQDYPALTDAPHIGTMTAFAPLAAQTNAAVQATKAAKFAVLAPTWTAYALTQTAPAFTATPTLIAPTLTLVSVTPASPPPVLVTRTPLPESPTPNYTATQFWTLQPPPSMTPTLEPGVQRIVSPFPTITPVVTIGGPTPTGTIVRITVLVTDTPAYPTLQIDTEIPATTAPSATTQPTRAPTRTYAPLDLPTDPPTNNPPTVALPTATAASSRPVALPTERPPTIVPTFTPGPVNPYPTLALPTLPPTQTLHLPSDPGTPTAARPTFAQIAALPSASPAAPAHAPTETNPYPTLALPTSAGPSHPDNSDQNPAPTPPTATRWPTPVMGGSSKSPSGAKPAPQATLRQPATIAEWISQLPPVPPLPANTTAYPVYDQEGHPLGVTFDPKALQTCGSIADFPYDLAWVPPTMDPGLEKAAGCSGHSIYFRTTYPSSDVVTFWEEPAPSTGRTSVVAITLVPGKGAFTGVPCLPGNEYQCVHG